jgi:hypothetical protein
MKMALVAFNGDPMCFAHVLLNALDMAEKGHEVEMVIEGAATKQIVELADPQKPFAQQYERVKDQGLVTAVCRACANKMGALTAAEEQGLPVRGEMSGHPPLIEYAARGYQIITL